MQYGFILGNHPQLSQAELKAVLDDFNIINNFDNILILEIKNNIKADELLDQLGGTIKIFKVIKEIKKIDELDLSFLEVKENEKLKFGFSVYKKNKFPKILRAIGLEFKKNLKAKNIKARLVESRENILSSVIIQKEKCQDIVLIYQKDKIIVGRTLAAQKFQEYSKRDYGRPSRDTHSGMLPPKLAKMMINLSQAQKDDLILDPFCGSGTILQEAWLMSYQNLMGSDISDKAVADSQKNLNWLDQNHKIKIFQSDARNISQKIDQKVNVIVTEVYLGPVKGEIKLAKTKQELKKIYGEVFKEFKKILKPGARLVIAFPAWRKLYTTNLRPKRIVRLNIKNELEGLGYRINDIYLYGRPDAQVLREIYVLSYE